MKGSEVTPLNVEPLEILRHQDRLVSGDEGRADDQRLV